MVVNNLQQSTSAYRDVIDDFEQLLEKNYIAHKEVTFYAENYSLSPVVFAKKVRLKWGKSPSKLIQERLMLESKRLLHLSSRSIKEIAAALQYKDEFYFSRFFKKMVGVSPKVFQYEADGIWFPKIGILGALLTVIISLVTLSFLIITPEAFVPKLDGDFPSPNYGFPYLSAAGRLVVKDIIFIK